MQLIDAFMRLPSIHNLDDPGNIKIDSSSVSLEKFEGRGDNECPLTQ